MSIAILGDVFKRVRTLLNDDDSSNWPDPRLLPKSIQAFEELEAELLLAGIPLLNSQTITMTIPAYNINFFGGVPLDISTVAGYPTDMILPIWMKENQVGETYRDFVDMVEVDFIPNIDPDVVLRYWAWFQGTIVVLGALNATQVMLRYQRLLSIPGLNTDSVIVPLSQMYLAPKIASDCCDSIGATARRDSLAARAALNLDRIVRVNILQQQDLPAKRRPYHRGMGRNSVLRDW